MGIQCQILYFVVLLRPESSNVQLYRQRNQSIHMHVPVTVTVV